MRVFGHAVEVIAGRSSGASGPGVGMSFVAQPEGVSRFVRARGPAWVGRVGQFGRGSCL